MSSSDEGPKPSHGSHVENNSGQLEAIRTISRVPANPNYHEKNGLRTEGDGLDHTHYSTKSVGFVMTVLGCSFALAGSQIVPLLYLTLGTTIAIDLQRTDLAIWLLTAILVAMGSLAPFVGPLADLFGRKWIFLCGFVCSIVGSIVCAATPTAPGFIAGQILLGFGAVIQELLAIAVVGEIVPTSKRTMYAALVLCAIIPWSPGTLYANLLATKSWRWIGLALAIWNVMNMVLIAIWYKPPPRVNSRGLSRKEIIARIDFVGGFLLIVGLVFFLIGLNWGGEQYPWRSAHVLSFLLVGVLLLIIFGFWEWFGAPYPLFPRRIVHAPRPFFCMMFVIFAAGINYVPLVVFWPIESISVFGADHARLGIDTLPIGMCILGGAILSAILLGVFKKQTTWLMTGFCIIQTVASACLTLIDPHDIRTAWAPVVLALIGTGGVLVPNQVVITIITPDDLIASVTALTVGLRAQAQVIGLAIFYNRLVAEVTKNTWKYVVPAMFQINYINADQITSMMTALTGMPFSQYVAAVPQLQVQPAYDIVQEATIQAFIHSFRYVWYITIAFGVTACIAAACMGDVSGFMDDHIAAPLDHHDVTSADGEQKT